MNEEILAKLYENASSKFDMPDFDTFKADMQDDSKLQSFRDNMSAHFDMPDVDTLRADLGSTQDVKKKDETQLPENQEIQTQEIQNQENQSQSDSDGEEGVQDTSLVSEETQEVTGQSESSEITPEPNPEKSGFDNFIDNFVEGKQFDKNREDNWRALSSGFKKVLADLAGVPNLLTKNLFTAFAPDEVLDYANSLDPDAREDFINGGLMMGGAANPAAPLAMLAKIGSDKQEELNKEVQEISSKMEQFDSSINDDLENGNYVQAAKRIQREVIGTAPSIVQTMIPYVGIPSVIAGSASAKQEELENEGEILSLRTNANAIINGVAEGALEIVTKKLGGKLFKSFKASGAGVVGAEKMAKELVKNLVVAPASEGASEMATGLIQNLSDALVQGREVDWDKAWEEAIDAGIIGGVIGGGIGGVTQVNESVKKASSKRTIERTINDSSYGDLSAAFNQPVKSDINATHIMIAGKPYSREILSKDLRAQVNEGVITADDAKQSLHIFDQTRKFLETTKGVGKNFTAEEVEKAVNLLKEKETLQTSIDKIGDDALATGQKNKLADINNQLTEMVAPQEVQAPDGKPTNNEVADGKPAATPEKKSVSKKTQGFFGDVVEGNKAKYKPSKEYEYESDFSETQDSFREEYDKSKGNFDEHIATSIPQFRDTQVKKGAAIVEILPEGGVVYDLGGSEGGFVKTITSQSSGTIKTINLDPNPNMQKAHEANPVEGSEFVPEAFQEGFDDVPAHVPTQKADIVHESMLFQFMNSERDSKIDEVKDKYLKDDGLFITEQKFKLTDKDIEAQNETIKNTQHKAKYFTEEQIKTKGEDVLIGMDKNQANFDEYIKSLESKFDHVQVYWTSGNFRGVVASNNKAQLDNFVSKLGDTSNNYTSDGQNKPVSDTNEGSEVQGDGKDKNVQEKSSSREAVETKINEMLDEGSTQEQIIKDLPDHEQNIATDFFKRQNKDSDADVIKQWEASQKKAQAELDGKVKENKTVSARFRKMATKLWDKQFLPKFILNNAGLERVSNAVITSAGASANAKRIFDKAYDKIYKGLDRASRTSLDEIIVLRRFIAIDNNRADRGLPNVIHQGFMNADSSQVVLDSMKEKLGEEKYNELVGKADAYFDEFRSLLTTMRDADIISQERLETFFEVDYQPREYLQFLRDADDVVNLDEVSRRERTSLNENQIKSLEQGSPESLLQDSEYLLSRSINMRAKLVAAQRMNTTFVDEFANAESEIDALRNKKNPSRKDKKRIKYYDELKSNVREDKIVGFTKSGQPKYARDGKNNDGFSSLYYYKDGVKHRFWMKDAMHEQYTNAVKGFWNANARENAAMLSGTAMIKSFATGNNPLFALTNFPRDFLFIVNFSDAYGKNVLKNAANVLGDFRRGVKDIKSESKRYEKFIEFGGGMEFLSIQGKFKGSNQLNKSIDKIVDPRVKEFFKSNKLGNMINSFNQMSEIGFRMAIFNKVVDNGLKKQGVESEVALIDKLGKEDAKKFMDGLYIDATARARSITDFAQGGSITKDADALVPYLNAATQGVRVAMDEYRKRPVETTFRITQTAVYTSVGMAMMSTGAIALLRDRDDEETKEMTSAEIYFETLKGVGQYDMNNYFIIPTGRKDSRGEWEYARIAKAQQLTPFLTMTEAMMRESLAKAAGVKYDGKMIENLKFAFEHNISPVDMSLTGNISKNPTIKAALSYSTGYDFFKDQPLSYQNGRVAVAAEGFESDKVEEFYKVFAEDSGMSPVRVKAVVESYITSASTNLYVGMVYGGLDTAFAPEENKSTGNQIQKNLKKAFTARVLKNTSEYNRRIDIMKSTEKAMAKEDVKQVKFKRDIKKFTDRIIAGEETKESVIEKLKGIHGDNEFDFKRAKGWIVDRIKNQDTPSAVWEMKYAGSAKKKAIVLASIFGDNLAVEGKKLSDLSDEEKDVLKKLKDKGLLSSEVLFEYTSFINAQNADK